MSFSLIGHDTNAQFSGTQASLSIASVNAGDLVFLAVYSIDSTSGFTVGDGSSTFTGLTAITASNNFAKIRGYYCLSSAASGTVTYTCSISPDNVKGLFAWVFRPSAAASFDAESGNDNSATTNPVTTITTTGTDDVCFGALVGESLNGAASNPSSRLINGVAASASDTDFFKASAWYTTAGSTFTGDATATISNQRALVIAAAFKIAGGGAAATRNLTLLGAG